MKNFERTFSTYTQDGSGQKSLKSKSGLLNLHKVKNQGTVKKLENVASLSSRNFNTFQGYFQINPSQTKTNIFYDERFNSPGKKPKSHNMTDTSGSNTKSFHIQTSHIDRLNARSFRINNPNVEFKEIKEYFLTEGNIITNPTRTSQGPQTSRPPTLRDNSNPKTETLPNKLPKKA